MRAAGDVGGEIISAGGTGTYVDNTWATEIQAGSYALMDTAYGKIGHPFGQALSVLGTVISVSPDHAVVNVGLKSLCLDHGLPTIEGAQVWFCSDEHTTFAAEAPVRVGDRLRVLPAHVDPDGGAARADAPRGRRDRAGDVGGGHARLVRSRLSQPVMSADSQRSGRTT